MDKDTLSASKYVVPTFKSFEIQDCLALCSILICTAATVFVISSVLHLRFIFAEARIVQTLYTPNEATVEKTVIETPDVFFSPESLAQELQKSIVGTGIDPADESVIICGNNDTVSRSYYDIVPGLGPLTLPFGTTHSTQDKTVPQLDSISVSVTKSTTSVTQGKVHVVKDIGDGTISIATTTFCGISHSVVSTSTQADGKPNAK